MSDSVTSMLHAPIGLFPPLCFMLILFSDLLVNPCFSYAFSVFNSNEFLMSAAVFQPNFLLWFFLSLLILALLLSCFKLTPDNSKLCHPWVCSAACWMPQFGSFGSVSLCVWYLLDLDTNTWKAWLYCGTLVNVVIFQVLVTVTWQGVIVEVDHLRTVRSNMKWCSSFLQSHSVSHVSMYLWYFPAEPYLQSWPVYPSPSFFTGAGL